MSVERFWQVRYDELPVARVGYPFIILSFVVAGFVSVFSFFVALPFWLLFLLIVYFFRNPHREAPQEDQAIVSAADGRVLSVDTLQSARYYQGPCRRVSIFMSPLNVHVNRIPYDGTIERVLYHQGKYLAAFSEKSSLDNEQNAVFLSCSNGQEIVCVQIAGFIARRIVCDARVGDTFKKGERYGFIRFGSRMDLYLPFHTTVHVRVGEAVKAGSTLLARF